MYNLGNITFGLAVDTSGLDRGARVLEGFGARVDRAMANSGRGIEYNTRALQKQEGVALRSLQQVQNLAGRIQQTRLDPQVKMDNINALNQAYEKLARQMATPINRTLDPLTMQRSVLGFKEQVDAVTRAVNVERQAADAVTTSVTKAFERQQMAALKAEHQVRSLNDQISRAASNGMITQKQASNLSSQAGTVGANYSNVMNSGALDPRQTLAANLNLKTSLQGLQRDLRQTASAGKPMVAMFHGLSDSAALVIGPLNGVVFRMRASHDMMSRYGVAIGGTAAALSGLAVTAIGLGQEIVRVTIAYQKSEVMLKGLLQNTAMATAELSWLQQTADRAGLSFSFLAPQFAQFIAAAQGSGQGLSKTNDQFERMSMIAGTMHMGADQMNRVLLAFDQILSAGRVLGDDMRQLRNVMPGAFEAASEAARKMGKTFRDESGKIDASIDPSSFITNFLDVYMKMFNIDLAKPIDSLQADLQRIKNSWDRLILAVTASIGASEGFQAAFQGIANMFNWLGANIDVVIAFVGALTGGLTGLFVVMSASAAVAGLVAFLGGLSAVFAILQAQLLALTPSTVAFSTAEIGATLTTAQLTAAQHGLNAAMMANPIGIVLKGLALLAGAALGGVWAYNTLKGAVQANNAALADTSSMDMYIEQQARMGRQISSVTKMMIKQAQVAALANRAALDAMRTDHERALQHRNDLNAGGVRGWVANTFSTDIDKAEQDQIIAQSAANLRSITNTVNQDTARTRALLGLLELPELDQGGGGNTPTGDKDKSSSSPDADRGLRQLNDIINRSQTAQALLDNMWRGPTHSGLIDALDEVKRRLFDMDPDQLERLNGLLRDAGVNVDALGGVADALAVITLRADAAEEMVKRFNDVWKNLQDGKHELEAMNRELQFLVNGGDPDSMFLVEAVNKARDTIRGLTTQDLPTLRATLESLTDASGSKSFNQDAISAIIGSYEESDAAGLTALKGALSQLGYEGATAEEALTNFYSTLGSSSQRVEQAKQFFGDFTQEVRTFKNTLESVTAAQGGSDLQGLLDLDYLQRARESTRLLGDEALEGLKTQLNALGIAGNDANMMLATFYRLQDEAAQQSEMLRGVLQGQIDAWTGFSTSSVDALSGALMGVKSFKEATLGILSDLAQTILNAAIFDPLKAQLSQTVSDMVSGKGGGLADVAGDFGRAGLRFLGMGGGVNEGDAAGLDTTATGLNLLNDAVSQTSDTLSLDFLSSLFRATVGTGAETSAQAINVLALNSATAALFGFTAALAAATATSAGNAAGDLLSTVATVMVAGGGQVRGPGSATSDSIPAMLSDQEFVVKASVAQKNLGLLHALNSGAKVRMYANGGQVTSEMASFRGMGTSGGPQMSGLTNRERPSKIDARTTIILQGQTTDAQMAELEARLDARDARLREEVPFLVDERVVDSQNRGRWG